MAPQPLGFLLELGILLDELADGLVTRFDLGIQEFAVLPGLAAAEGIGVVFGAIGFSRAAVEELAAAARDVGQLLLLRSGRCRGWGLHRGGKIGEERWRVMAILIGYTGMVLLMGMVIGLSLAVFW